MSASLSYAVEGERVHSIQFRPIAQNKIDEGEPDVHEEHTDNLFSPDTRVAEAGNRGQAHYILERLADLSRPFGTTVVVNGDMAEIKLKPGR